MKRVVGFHPAQANAFGSEMDLLTSSFSRKGRISQPTLPGPQEPVLSGLGARKGKAADFDCYAHRTATRHLPAIHAEGLVAGKSRGMGDPETGEPVPDAIFVATGRGALLDTAECAVGVVSARPPEPDPNYKPDRRTGENPAGVFHRGTIPPLREAGVGDRPTATTPYSFTMPMTPRTVAGAGWYVRQVTGETVSDEEAAKRVKHEFKTRFPLDHRAANERAGTVRKAAPSASEAPPKRVRSDDDMFQMDL